MENRSHEVVVMGGGLAGLALANQLKQRDPGIDILVAERTEHPPPVAAHKVGESTVEGGAYYYREVLGLKPYLEKHQLHKSGLRWFYSDTTNTDIARRVEYGAHSRLAVDTSQLDRGTLEAKLAEDAVEAGVVFLDKCKVRDVAVGEGDEEHTVQLKREGEDIEVKARWVVDATGRFGLLKRKLGLAEDVYHKANAAWFRLPRKIDLTDWSDDPKWKERLEPFRHEDGREDTMRYLSTNHLTGPGYWLWFIPLADEYTSVGIVVDDERFPIGEINTLDKAMAWIEENEPQAYSVVEPLRDEVMDFLFLRRYSHSCKQVYSRDRWCITGVSGVFHDPLFSYGSDMIGVSNTFVTDLIARDHAGEDVSHRTDLYNKIFLEKWAHPVFSVFNDKYKLMGNPQIFTTYVHWTTNWYWSINCNMFMHDKTTDLEVLGQLAEESDKAIKLLEQGEAFLVEWHRAVGDDLSKTDYYIPFAGHKFMKDTHKYLNKELTDEEFVRDFKGKLKNMEALAIEIFWMAVESLPDPPERRPINPYVMTLDRDRWEADGLFDVSEAPEPIDWKGDPIDWDDELAELYGVARLPDAVSS